MAVSPSDARTVLLVDDEPMVINSIRRALSRSRFDIRSATSADEGLRMLANDEFAVVVSDHRMPGMCGSEFLGLVRERHPSTMRLMLTGESDIQLAAEAINRAGVFRLLLKPCPTEALIAAIEAALAARHHDTAHSATVARLGVEANARAALDRGLESMWMAFQPIVEAATGVVIAYEALARSREPALLTPDHLLLAAGHQDRLLEFERRARRLVANRLPEVPASCSVFVNLLPQSLYDDQLLDPDGDLGRYASRIVLEITERSAIDDDSALLARITALRALGFRFAIDDLGSGYSGLNSFAVIVPEFVKYDRELINGAATSSAKTCLLRSMNAVCNVLGVLPLAEGIETEVERDHAISVGCAYLQGYFFGRPAPNFDGTKV